MTTPTPLAPEAPVEQPSGGLLQRLLKRPLKVLSPSQLLLSKYKLTRTEKLILVAWGLALSQVASPVGNAIYFCVTQLRYTLSFTNGIGLIITYPKAHNAVYATFGVGRPSLYGTGITGYLGDVWDRLTVHLANLLHLHLGFLVGPHQQAPAWWVTVRHDFRYVLIGALIHLLVKSVTVGMGKSEPEPVDKWRILASPLTVIAMALLGAIPGILLFTALPPASWLARHGLLDNNSYFGQYLAGGKWELLLIGLGAGQVAQLAYTRVAATLQVVSIDRKLCRGRTEKWWWKFVYTPAWMNRFEYLRDASKLPEGDPGRHVPEDHGKALGTFLAVGSLAFVVLLAAGIWIKYFGPAKGV